MIAHVLISRLRSAYWPAWCAQIRLSVVRRAEPIAEYIDEGRRHHGYDAGRIRYFMDQLEAGRAIDPIRIAGGRTSDQLIYDGHHRYMAAVFLRRRRVPARFYGPPELGQWLVGERRRWRP